MRHPSLKCHPSPLGHGWDLVECRCRPVHHNTACSPSESRQAEDSGCEDEEEGDDGVQKRRENSSEDSSESDCSETECTDLD